MRPKVLGKGKRRREKEEDRGLRIHTLKVVSVLLEEVPFKNTVQPSVLTRTKVRDDE